MKKLFAIILCATAVFLTACGMNSGGESTAATTAPSSVTERLETHSNEITSAHAEQNTLIEQNTLRLDGDYDSVPTVTLPKRLTEDELKAIKIPTSKDDPYSYKIAKIINGYQKSGSNSEMDRYFLYDLNGDGTDELIIGSIYTLGGDSLRDNGMSVPPTYGILIDKVYITRDGEAVIADKPIIRGDAYQTEILDNGLIKVTCSTTRNPWIYYLKMVNSKFEFYGYPLCRNYNGEYFSYENDIEEKITEEEYNRRIAEIEGGAKPIELEWKHLQDYGK